MPDIVEGHPACSKREDVQGGESTASLLSSGGAFDVQTVRLLLYAIVIHHRVFEQWQREATKGVGKEWVPATIARLAVLETFD